MNIQEFEEFCKKDLPKKEEEKPTEMELGEVMAGQKFRFIDDGNIEIRFTTETYTRLYSTPNDYGYIECQNATGKIEKFYPWRPVRLLK